MEHSKNYFKVKDYFDKGYWTEEMVKNSVLKNWITESEYREIVTKEA